MQVKFARCAQCTAASPGCGDADLVTRVVAGDDAAFDCLFRLHYAQVYNFVRHIAAEDVDTSADIVQSAFVRAFEALPRLRDGQTFLKYMYRICINLVRDRSRASARRPWTLFSDLLGRNDEQGDRLPPAGESTDPEKVVIGGARSAELRRQIAALPLDQREVLVLHHLQNLEIQQIARIVGVPEGTVKSRLGRARSRLRTRLRSWAESADESR